MGVEDYWLDIDYVMCKGISTWIGWGGGQSFSIMADLVWICRSFLALKGYLVIR